MKKITFVLLAVLYFVPIAIFGQTSNDIIKYLNDALSLEFSVVSNGAMSQINNTEIIKVRMDLKVYNDEYGSGGPTIEKYYAKIGGELKKIQTPQSLIETPEFIQNFNRSFELKTPEDGLVLQTALNVITEDERNEGFFVHDNKWYFIRSEFWGRYFVVKTDSNGKITSLKHTSGIEENIPDEVYYYGETKIYPDFVTPELNETLKKQVAQIFKEEINYRFEIEEGFSEFFNRISFAKFHNAKFIVTEQYDNEEYESSYFFNLIAYDGKITVASNIWETDLFLESMKPVFQLNTDLDALLFQDFLNEQESKDQDVRFYKEDDLWMFVRDESFGDEEGYIVKTDNNGTITRIGNRSGFSESEILRFRMQEPGFEVDYGFHLNYPEEGSFSFKKDEIDEIVDESRKWIEVDVSIEFNEQAVNAMGAWILTRFKGENVGMLASSNMVSPFTSSIPISSLGLEIGTHEVEYYLLGPGKEDTENPLARVVIELVVE